MTRWQQFSEWVLDQVCKLVGLALGIGVIVVVKVERWRWQRALRKRYKR